MRDAMLVAILAAGASHRLGRPKQLVDSDGETLVRRQCRTALEAAIGPVVVVLGCHHERVGAAVSGLGVQPVVNGEWEEGLAASVRAATRAAMAAGAAAVLLYHCDQYAITPADLFRLRQAWVSSPSTVLLAREGEHIGPPAVLPARLFPSLLRLKGDTGPRTILHGDADIREVPMPSASLDIDWPADLETLKARPWLGQTAWEAGSSVGLQPIVRA
jgi:CTP:molybdopterin cytidylyltransferase MocA